MCYGLFFFFFKQKTAYEMRISDWSSDVCSSDLLDDGLGHLGQAAGKAAELVGRQLLAELGEAHQVGEADHGVGGGRAQLGGADHRLAVLLAALIDRKSVV